MGDVATGILPTPKQIREVGTSRSEVEPHVLNLRRFAGVRPLRHGGHLAPRRRRVAGAIAAGQAGMTDAYSRSPLMNECRAGRSLVAPLRNSYIDGARSPKHACDHFGPPQNLRV